MGGKLGVFDRMFEGKRLLTVEYVAGSGLNIKSCIKSKCATVIMMKVALEGEGVDALLSNMVYVN